MKFFPFYTRPKAIAIHQLEAHDNHFATRTLDEERPSGSINHLRVMMTAAGAALGV
jgi:hypothetical protein